MSIQSNNNVNQTSVQTQKLSRFSVRSSSGRFQVRHHTPTPIPQKQKPPTFPNYSDSSSSSSINHFSQGSTDSGIELLEADLKAFKTYQEAVAKALRENGMKTVNVSFKDHATCYENLQNNLQASRKSISFAQNLLNRDKRRSFEALVDPRISTGPSSSYPESLIDLDASRQVKRLEKEQILESEYLALEDTDERLQRATGLIKANHKFLHKGEKSSSSADQNDIGLNVSKSMAAILDGKDRDSLYLLGEGSFGSVFASKYGTDFFAKKSAHTSKKEKELALLKESLVREAGLALFLNSDFIMKPSMVSEEKDIYFPVACSGDLRNVYKKKLFAEKELLISLYAIAKGLEDMHAKGFVHRDLKPENVFVLDLEEACSKVKIGDLGLADLVTKTNGQVVGTPAYIAPEVFTDPENPSVQSDIFSFAVMIYELLVNTIPYPSEISKLDKNGQATQLMKWAMHELTKEGKVQEMFAQAIDTKSVEKKLEAEKKMLEHLEAQIQIQGSTDELNTMLEESQEVVEDLERKLELKKVRSQRLQTLDPTGSIRELMFKAFNPNPKARPTASEMRIAIQDMMNRNQTNEVTDC